ncbi:MAG: type II secretion system minor pseudopilin GspK [Thiohalomonadales bacterium]
MSQPHKPASGILRPFRHSASRQQSGVALITAVLITAMVSIVAVAMAAKQALDMRRTANILHSDQAYLYALSAEVFAKAVLAQDPDLAVDTRDDIWAQPLPPTPVQGGSIAGSMIDLNGAFPLNNLVDDAGIVNPAYFAAFRRLLGANILNLKRPDAAAAGVADWIDKNDTPSNGGAEDLDYLSLDRPHRAGNTAMVSLSELQVIIGFYVEETEEGKERDLDLLLPRGKAAFVNVLPRGAKINVNTASVEVLMSLHEKITAAIAQQIVARQTGETSEPFKNKNKIGEEIAEIAGIKDNPRSTVPAEKKARDTFIRALDKLNLDIKSEYFEVTAAAEIGTASLIVKSLIQRPANASNAASAGTIKTLRRGIGVY